MEKIFKMTLPENQDCRAEIVVAWAKLGGVSITASDVTATYGPKGQQITTSADTTPGPGKKTKVTKKGNYADADKD